MSQVADPLFVVAVVPRGSRMESAPPISDADDGPFWTTLLFIDISLIVNRMCPAAGGIGPPPSIDAS